MKKLLGNTKSKKTNITLKRKLGILYGRVILVLKLLFLIITCLFFFTNSFVSVKENLRQEFYEMTADLGFTLQNVIIEGQENLSTGEIIAALKADKGTPLFAIKLSEVKQSLESNPWVYSAFVQRKLPSTILVGINEYKPIAIWQFNHELYLISAEGARITNKSLEKYQNLLHVVGSDANLYAYNLMQSLARHPELAKLVKSAVRYGQRRWNLNLEEDIVVKMPETDFDKAYDYIAALNSKDKLFGQGYKAIDLRNKEKYYIE